MSGDWPISGTADAEILHRHSLALEPDAAAFTDELEISDAELQEFLEADLEPPQADPEFREQLREQLWAMVESGEVGRRRDH